MFVYDNIINKKDNDFLYDYLLKCPYYYGETDNYYTPPTGMVMKVTDENLFNSLNNICIDKNPDLRSLKLERAYVNLFFPNERPYFHTDGEVYTCLFYITKEENLDEGGETQFLIDEKIIGILPKLGRMVMFDGTILHRATSFRTKPRFTIAFKYLK